MDYQKCMNSVLDYIESNLSENVDYSVAAQLLNCSEWEFRRIFSMLAQISISEYIRRRRLSSAVEDIKNGEKIIDIAMRYRYESPSAFSRAFRNFFGVAPSLVRNNEVVLKTYPRLTFKLILMEGIKMNNDQNQRTNIIGAGEVDYAVSIEMEEESIRKTNSAFWDTNGNDVLGTMALPMYGAFITEEKCQLFGDVTGKKLLEVGCGRGHSLEYMANRNASELWGIDISKEQVRKSNEYLTSCGITANLICSSMEEECGIPKGYFDYVYSVYGIGWTTDLVGTFCHIASYLKSGGAFIFSWSHPIHKCVTTENDRLVFKKSYFDESWYSVPLDGRMLSLSDRKMSTYVNALAKAGFIIEEMVEESDENIIKEQLKNDFAKKAKMLPVTFVIKAKKL
ncbi:MAG: helix-turn-helix domain-containing protein [Cellulosilyticaceae bacterium]